MTDSARRSRLHAAAVEGRVALGRLRDLLVETESTLAVERRQLADAERRGGMATQIGDAETARVAEEFVTRHRERVAVLEQKLEAQRAELTLLERDVEDLVRQLKSAGGDVGPVPHVASDETERLRTELDQQQREAAADAMLENLKKRMGR